MVVVDFFPLAGTSEIFTFFKESDNPGSSPGRKKCSTSICVNSRILKGPCLGDISFLKALPIWAPAKGNLPRFCLSSHGNAKNILCAVSGLRYPGAPLPEPTPVENIRLKAFSSDSSAPQFGQAVFETALAKSSLVKASPPSTRWSALNCFPQSEQSTSASSNSPKWPDAWNSVSGPIKAPSSSRHPASIM